MPVDSSDVASLHDRWTNVIAGTYCGMMRVHHEICWGKPQVMAEGARIAGRELWQRS